MVGFLHIYGTISSIKFHLPEPHEVLSAIGRLILILTGVWLPGGSSKAEVDFAIVILIFG